MPIAGPFTPIAAPPMAGVAPPPVGPRTVNAAVIAAVKDAIKKLLEVVELEKDEGLKGHVDKLVAPLIKQAIQVRHQLSEPVKPPSEEAEDADGGPLDTSSSGMMGQGGTPILSALPRLLGMGGG